jgi:ribonuclease BN (tRNA processing enzyme)
MDTSDIGALAEEANVKLLALNHLAPKPQSRRQANLFFRDPVLELYSGELFVGEDGTIITIPID